jgi:hypothetical protein
LLTIASNILLQSNAAREKLKHELFKYEKGAAGPYIQVLIRRLARQRGMVGFGNARAVENVLSLMRDRQMARVAKEKPKDIFQFTQVDIIGPKPCADLLESCDAWKTLKGMTGLETVKLEIAAMVKGLEAAYQLEMNNKPPRLVTLNRALYGNPGTHGRDRHRFNSTHARNGLADSFHVLGPLCLPLFFYLFVLSCRNR